ncbi:hypothetical protein PT2222_150240 [Paraburkholderia tropica]
MLFFNDLRGDFCDVKHATKERNDGFAVDSSEFRNMKCAFGSWSWSVGAAVRSGLICVNRRKSIRASMSSTFCVDREVRNDSAIRREGTHAIHEDSGRGGRHHGVVRGAQVSEAAPPPRRDRAGGVRRRKPAHACPVGRMGGSAATGFPGRIAA